MKLLVNELPAQTSNNASVSWCFWKEIIDNSKVNKIHFLVCSTPCSPTSFEADACRITYRAPGLEVRAESFSLNYLSPTTWEATSLRVFWLMGSEKILLYSWMLAQKNWIFKACYFWYVTVIFAVFIVCS